MKPDDKTLLTVREVADEAGVSQGFIRKEINEGRLKTIRLGRLIRITPDAWKTYLTASRKEIFPNGG